MPITADGAPFEVKERLKARGYRWNPTIRRWWIEVALTVADDEQAWLADEAACHNPTIEQITWHRRHRVTVSPSPIRQPLSRST